MRNDGSQLLFQLYEIINDDGSKDDLVGRLLDNIDLVIGDEEIISFLSSFSHIHDYKAFTICGSGGSGIIKPNISSIACMFLASIGIPIIKIGSRHMSGVFGSTDFFESLGLMNCIIQNASLRFSYYDINFVSKWKNRIHELIIHPSFADFFSNNNYTEFSCTGKMVGCIGKQKSKQYLNRKQINVSGNVYSYYSPLNNMFIDECVGTEVIINQKAVTIPSKGAYSPLDINDIININNALVTGKETSELWYFSLRNTVSLALYMFGQTSSIQAAFLIFDEKYPKGIINSFVQM